MAKSARTVARKRPRKARHYADPAAAAVRVETPPAPEAPGPAPVDAPDASAPAQAPASSAPLTHRSEPSYHPERSIDGLREPSDMATFGETLRRERELRQVSLREVSEATKINVRYLQALERNDFTYLPGGAFTRGFIRAYARYIGIDDAEMVNAYLYEIARDAPPEETATLTSGSVDPLRQQFRLQGGRIGGGHRKARYAVVLGGIAFLILVTTLIVWTAMSWRSGNGDPVSAPPSQEVAP